MAPPEATAASEAVGDGVAVEGGGDAAVAVEGVEEQAPVELAEPGPGGEERVEVGGGDDTGDAEPGPVEGDDVGGDDEPFAAPVPVGVLERVEIALAHGDQRVGPALLRGASFAGQVVAGGGGERLLDRGGRVGVDEPAHGQLVADP